MTLATQNLSQRFPGKRVFITGAASGLGLAIAESLAREGWRLILTDAEAERLSVVVASLQSQGVAAIAAPCDVRDATALQALVDNAMQIAQGIDVAIHAAGVAAAGPFYSTTTEDWRWVFDVNVHGVVNSCKAVVPIMRKAGTGLIINIASAASFCTGANMSIYNSAKAAVVALSETLMQELKPDGVQVVAAMLGFFRTRLLDSARGPDKVLVGARRIMEGSNLDAATVAEYLLAAAARGRTHVVYPSRYQNLWRLKRAFPQGFQTFFPRLADRSK